MNYQLTLSSGAVYLSNLKTIIDYIKKNGNKPTCHTISISHPKGIEIQLYMNFALEQNSDCPPKYASLNILGFKTTTGEEFVFDINPFPCSEFSKNATTIPINGSYKSLGYPLNLPIITDSNLLESITILNQFKGTKEIQKQELDALTRLIIATSEAVRFSSVANGINSVLGNSSNFTPNSFEIIGWGGHSIAS
ncbi:ribosome-inactivating family protein [Flavobacterium sp. SUN052]|uniref:ribosome-inactivating family protein n=1 Tax=Flavobacterium sp. SUN052 TaxID=3002441 RepID=UPI00237D918B|nr:ribosome-inactivating family protein [Flavobacterium sp. SUN052]MEC4004337.1 ribosome-inactivating family protein [Flavobacterium sp. SUN052]